MANPTPALQEPHTPEPPRLRGERRGGAAAPSLCSRRGNSGTLRRGNTETLPAARNGPGQKPRYVVANHPAAVILFTAARRRIVCSREILSFPRRLPFSFLSPAAASGCPRSRSAAYRPNPPADEPRTIPVRMENKPFPPETAHERLILMSR